MGKLSIEELQKMFAFHKKMSTLCLELFNYYANSPYKKLSVADEVFMKQMQLESEMHSIKMMTYSIAIEKGGGFEDDIQSTPVNPDPKPHELILPPKDYEL